MENVALRQKAYQTNIYQGLDASRAVDRGSSYSHYSGSCAHTYSTANAYWEVDLGRKYFIDHVTIFNRQDWISDRLRDVELYVGLTKSNYQRYGYHKGVVGLVYTFELAESVIGQWVRITRIPSVVDYLTLCEVQVFAFNAAKFFIIENSLMGTETFIQASIKTASTHHCAYICHKTDGCDDARYHEDTHMCDLLASSNTEEAVAGTMFILK
ncbi:fucolectin-like [Mercenaria mercenaria]|uniref:fucolectin-like n=1 Tax=Mercenaria mercenaria TaxID=6596 RepID=UPI00234E71C8|nr:fucolectin-like [Mercenaria mercenaria]